MLCWALAGMLEGGGWLREELVSVWVSMAVWVEGGLLEMLGVLSEVVRVLGPGAETVPSRSPCCCRGVEEGELTCPVDAAGACGRRIKRFSVGSVAPSPPCAVVDGPALVPGTLLPAVDTFASADAPAARRRS